jgi:hypothetical protein
VDGEAAKTWILTGSLDNFRATRKRGFRTVSAEDGETLEEAMQGANQLEPAA